MAKKPNITNRINNLVIYDRKNNTYKYPQGLFNIENPNGPVWGLLSDNEIITGNVASMMKKQISHILDSEETKSLYDEFEFMIDNESRNFLVVYSITKAKEEVVIDFVDISKEIKENEYLKYTNKIDILTKMYYRYAFTNEVKEVLSHTKKQKYALVYFDLLNFKVVNDMYGSDEGNKILIFVSDVIKKALGEDEFAAHLEQDHFLTFMKNNDILASRVEKIIDEFGSYDLPLKVSGSAGIYIIDDPTESVDIMIDRAINTLNSIKNSYNIKYAFYNSLTHNEMISQQEILGTMDKALENNEFIVEYQPIYNHSLRRLAGAEALVRWIHPIYGKIPPLRFIPLFEQNGFISKVDIYVFEKVCKFIRRMLDSDMDVCTISVNLSRHDLGEKDFIDQMEVIRKKYNVPVKYIRIEITESSMFGSIALIQKAIDKLHDHGYLVLMDDFGSGSSSLNSLKELDCDILKLDMKFIGDAGDNKRGGIIIESVIRMTKWLNLPVVAEGVETKYQADFLRTIGCQYVQGYLYSRSLSETQFEDLLINEDFGDTVSTANLTKDIDMTNFWSPNSLETLIFNSYVGGAIIASYHNKEIEVLRVNEKCIKELGMISTEERIINHDFFLAFDEYNKNIYIDCLEKTIETKEEQECDTWQTVLTECCGKDKICVRSTMRLIGVDTDTFVFYITIRNVTNEKRRYIELVNNESRFKEASEQANIYYWEYDVKTKDMFPCFRCMRDLGLPAVVHNYPEPAIDMGIFPKDYADMYRDWHKQIENGVESLEAIIPLTISRVPFIVRYTVKFDDFGKPVKAYGSATLVVDDNKDE